MLLSAMDEAVGGIVDKLKASGMYENTVFFYTTDNGGLCGAGGRNAPFRGQKATLWQGGLRVPAFMSGMNVREGETYSNSFVHSRNHSKICFTFCIFHIW